MPVMPRSSALLLYNKPYDEQLSNLLVETSQPAGKFSPISVPRETPFKERRDKKEVLTFFPSASSLPVVVHKGFHLDNI